MIQVKVLWTQFYVILVKSETLLSVFQFCFPLNNFANGPTICGLIINMYTLIMAHNFHYIKTLNTLVINLATMVIVQN